MENNNQIRVAQIIGKWNGGGVEATVMNYYRNIDHKKIQFDFFCDEDSTNIPYKEIYELGGKVILVPPYQNIISYQKKMRHILNNKKYKIVHSHINTLSVFPLYAAKKAGIPIRIAHSHSTANKKECKKTLIKNILKIFSKKYATNYFCCSELAGRWLFGNKTYDDGKVVLIKNAIDLEKFKYDENIRKNKRKEYNISKDTLVIGHLGRFVKQKNHDFLIDIFYEVHKKIPNSILILAGDGPLRKKIENKIKRMNLKDSVIFLGNVKNSEEIYQIFDVVLFPSLYEGLGMVIIEAQAIGIPCIVSTEVPNEAKLTKLVKFVNLNESTSRWLMEIEKIIKEDNKREYSAELKENGYDIKKEAIKLENEYMRCIDGE